MKLIFLDIDGVLNTHETLSSGYCGICRDRAALLNGVLLATGARIVLSSAWRYMHHSGEMTLKGMEFLLLIHGIGCQGVLHGVTAKDGNAPDDRHFDAAWWRERGLEWRVQQIEEYVAIHQPEAFVVVDDLPLVLPDEIFVQTYPANGLTRYTAGLMIEILNQ